jgi:hypothetical protein
VVEESVVDEWIATRAAQARSAGAQQS